MGRVWKFGDNISTDLLCPGRVYHLRNNLDELAKYTLIDVNPDFAKNVKQGDFVAGGIGFGTGSSREYAAIVLKHLGVKAVIAQSFARIFYRNAINIGLPILEADTSQINDGDELEVYLENGIINNQTRGNKLKAFALPPVMLEILNDGGLIAHIKKNKGFKL
ncbi:TPA: 3-isopropylmalate dehydratase small subunit [archaeon]|uniref:3-isopropylmalate dehydratase small subunit n=1 Tax=Candidatus Naiadarchaeum limnaeum TaxID=2756139 RepID=A0A832X612_9ARCH|nr:3-isopropylmalate dehydratase small subunit [Candidatus Naiadarchaeum limnaeum]